MVSPWSALRGSFSGRAELGNEFVSFSSLSRYSRFRIWCTVAPERLTPATLLAAAMAAAALFLLSGGRPLSSPSLFPGSNPGRPSLIGRPETPDTPSGENLLKEPLPDFLIRPQSLAPSSKIRFLF